MTPDPIIPQANEDVFEVIGADDGRDPASMDQFIESLEQSFEYPSLATIGQTDEQIAAEILGNEGQEVPDEEDEDEEIVPPVPPVEGDPPPEVPPALPADHVLVNGQPVPIADIQRLYEFDQYLRSNPDAAARVQQAVQPAVPTPESTPPANQELTPPDFLDMEDPAHKFMWESHVAQQKQLAAFQQQTVAQAQQAAVERANADMALALERWKTSHPNFNEDQIIEVRKHAASMNVIDSLMATSTTPVDALVRAMDLAAIDNPDLRNVYLDTSHKTPSRKQQSATRKGKLNALGGTSGSVPRTTTPSRPQTDREAIDEFAKGLAESFQQN